MISFSASRKVKLKTRLSEPSFDFYKVLQAASQSSFILKEECTWFKLDWILENDNNYIKVLEGQYFDKVKEVPCKSLWEQLTDFFIKEYGFHRDYISSNIASRFDCGDLERMMQGITDQCILDFVEANLNYIKKGYNDAHRYFDDLQKRRAEAEKMRERALA